MVPNLPRRAAAFAALALVPCLANAHFVLQEPESWRDQNVLGDPQKLGPCGDDGDAATTGIVTAYEAGETITIRLRETIFHPGHYRVALSVDDRSELPEPPVVTPGSTACGSAPIDPDPAFPVLVDGALVHTRAFDGPQTIEVTLPADVTCEKCTLQVIQFMSNHALNNPGGCYYSHCADISLSAPVTDDTEPVEDTGDVEEAAGCACSSSGGALLGLPALLVLGAVGRRRR